MECKYWCRKIPVTGGFAMRLVAKLFVFLSAVGLIVGCASLGPANGTGGTGGAGGGGTPITVFCSNTVAEGFSPLDWELTVRNEPIKSGEPFTATIEGVAVFPEDYLDSGHEILPRGVQRANLVELNATVQVRSGATGQDVTLIPDPERYPYTCEGSDRVCDPANDIEGDPPKLPGLRGNTDCEGENRCGRFLALRTSTDCEPGGECDRLGKRDDQCTDLRNSCITGGLRIYLKPEFPPAQYTADVQAEEVLFGWADEGTRATYEDDPTDPNYGTYILPTLYDGETFFNEEAYREPAGLIGFRATFENFVPVALECVMGVACEVGVDCTEARLKRTPDSELIRFPIETEAP
jgi:hypothetical protein